MDDFQDKVILVTGAGQGIGFEIARHFHKERAIVYINDIDEKLCNSAVLALGGNEKRCFSIPGDASDVHFITSMVSQILTDSQKLDVTVANAGITLFKNSLEITPQELTRVIELNIKGTFFLLQESAKAMIKKGIQGKLIAMSSITGRRAHKDLATYGMTKAAIESLVQNLVLDLSQYGITINAIAPGATITERTTKDKNYMEEWSRLTPTGKPSSTKDIANIALYLASEKAAQITGQTIVVDGGWSTASPGPSI